MRGVAGVGAGFWNGEGLQVSARPSKAQADRLVAAIEAALVALEAIPLDMADADADDASHVESYLRSAGARARRLARRVAE